MKYISTYTDRLAISLSALCVLHCLATPLIVVFLPSVIAVQFESEAFHSWLLLAVIPTSALSLLIGCKQHKQYQLIGFGVVGGLFLVSAIFMEGLANGELLEKIFTVVGACVIAVGHYLNYSLCKKKQKSNCGCK